MKIKDMSLIAIFVTLIAVCSWFSIPYTIPFTLQTLGVFLCVGILGGKKATLVILCYQLLGLMGIPVFSGFSGGFSHLLTASGGYIIGFLFISLTVWIIEKFYNKTKWAFALSMLIGLFLCYIFATIWFMIIYTKNTGQIGFWASLILCVLPYIIPDILKLMLSLMVCKRLRKILKV